MDNVVAAYICHITEKSKKIIFRLTVIYGAVLLKRPYIMYLAIFRTSLYIDNSIA